MDQQKETNLIDSIGLRTDEQQANFLYVVNSRRALL